MGLGILGWIIVGLIAGWVAEKVMDRDHGLLTNLVVGVVGAIIGGWLAGALGLNVVGFWGALIVAIVGAIILLAGLQLIRGR